MKTITKKSKPSFTINVYHFANTDFNLYVDRVRKGRVIYWEGKLSQGSGFNTKERVYRSYDSVVDVVDTLHSYVEC